MWKSGLAHQQKNHQRVLSSECTFFDEVWMVVCTIDAGKHTLLVLLVDGCIGIL